VVNMLRATLKEGQPECVAFVVDASGPTFRDERWIPQYKANREADARRAARAGASR
jgi:DNA polymerase I